MKQFNCSWNYKPHLLLLSSIHVQAFEIHMALAFIIGASNPTYKLDALSSCPDQNLNNDTLGQLV